MNLVLSSSFSLEGDILSQWRAYADNGQGYVIGFKSMDLVKLPVKPLKVLYDTKRQINELSNLIRVLHSVEQGLCEEEQYGSEFFNSCASIAYDLAAYKNPAFSEEKEVRLTHLLNFKQSNKFLKLEAVGGTAFGIPAPPSKIQFRTRGSGIIPYIDLSYCNEETNPIKEVILGPKNDMRVTAISVFLETVGIGNVNVRKSIASY